MQRPGGEGDRVVRGYSPSQEETDSRLQDGGDRGATVQPDVQECGSQNPSEQDPDDPTPALHPDFSGADDGSPAATNSVQENVAHLPLTLPLSKLHISEDMEDQEPLPEEAGEEEEFVVLDSEHPLVREQQAALNRLLRKHLERLDLELKEKLAREKEDEAELKVLRIKEFKIQEELARLQTRMDDIDRSKAQAKAERLQVQDELEAVRRQHSIKSSQLEKTKTNVFKLEAELDHLNLQLIDKQRAAEDLSSNFKAMKNFECKSRAEKNKKTCQLLELKREIKAVRLECSKMSNQLDRMSLIQKDLDEQIAARKKLHDDPSPLQIKEKAIMAELEEVTAKIKSDQQLWMTRQGTLLGLMQKLEANSDDILKLQTECTALQQRKIYLDSQIEVEHREEKELDKEMKMRRRDLLKLNTLVRNNGKLSQKLEQENALMETEFVHRLKEAERETLEMQMQLEKSQDKKEKLQKSLLEAERQIVLWKKKTQLAKETRSAMGKAKEEKQMMEAEIHRMELRLNKLKKQQKQMKRESVAAVARFESVLMRRETMRHNSRRKATKDVSQIHKHSMLRKIKDTRKQVSECEQVTRELQEKQVSASDRLAQQKQRLIELHDTSNVLDRDLENLQDTKDRNLRHLMALQSRAKKLQAACEGRYRPLTNSESVGAALQRQKERVHTVNTILHCVCEEFPQYQGVLRKPLKALAEGIQDLEQEKSDVDMTVSTGEGVQIEGERD